MKRAALAARRISVRSQLLRHHPSCQLEMFLPVTVVEVIDPNLGAPTWGVYELTFPNIDRDVVHTAAADFEEEQVAGTKLAFGNLRAVEAR